MSLYRNPEFGTGMMGWDGVRRAVIEGEYNWMGLPIMISPIQQVLGISSIPPSFYLFQVEALMLNVSCNHIIYTYTSVPFRRFLVHLVTRNLNGYPLVRAISNL